MFTNNQAVLLLIQLILNPFQETGAHSYNKYFPERTVELAVFYDQYLYHHWISILSSPAAIQYFIESYLEALIKSLNLIYAHPSLGEVHIGFHLTHSQLFWRGDEGNADDQNREVASEYLEVFCDWAAKENWSGSRWDHALLLTGIDLKFPDGANYAVAGISWDNSMCNKSYSCSLVEGNTFRSVMTAAHEIGHSLGIEHDGLKYKNWKCPARGYIMSHEGGGPSGRIAWSPCSKYNLKYFLTTAPSVLSNQAKCLYNKPRAGARGMWGFKGNRGGKGILPGRQFSLREQCQLGGGMEWMPSSGRGHNKKLCSMLYCVNNATKQITPFHPALEGTPCGINKVFTSFDMPMPFCQYGECKHGRTLPPPRRPSISIIR